MLFWALKGTEMRVEKARPQPGGNMSGDIIDHHSQPSNCPKNLELYLGPIPMFPCPWAQSAIIKCFSHWTQYSITVYTTKEPTLVPRVVYHCHSHSTSGFLAPLGSHRHWKHSEGMRPPRPKPPNKGQLCVTVPHRGYSLVKWQTFFPGLWTSWLCSQRKSREQGLHFWRSYKSVCFMPARTHTAWALTLVNSMPPSDTWEVNWFDCWLHVHMTGCPDNSCP